MLTVSPHPTGDLDDDCDLDFDDVLVLFGCLSGPGAAPPPDCRPADLDADEDVDLVDLSVLQAAFAAGNG